MKHTILIIDDDALIVNTLRKRFNTFGIEVYGANTPQEAKNVLEKIVPEVVILDLLLTEEDGSEGVLDFLKSQERLENVPVLILTNLDKPELGRFIKSRGKGVFGERQFELRRIVR